MRRKRQWPRGSDQVLWERFKDAKGRRIAERNALIQAYLPFVNSCAVKLSRKMPAAIRSAVSSDDLVSAAIPGLMRSIDLFEPQRGFQFLTFAAPRIRGAMLDYLRELDPLARSHRLELKRAGQRLTILPLPHPRWHAGEAVRPFFRYDAKPLFERWEDFQEQLRGLNPPARILLGLYFWSRYTLKKASARLGFSESRGSQLLTASLEFLRQRSRLAA